MQERDIIERLMDFEGEGRTATERVKLREEAAMAIFKLRQGHTPETRPARHAYVPHRKYPWFCSYCGYPEHETLQHE